MPLSLSFWGLLESFDIPWLIDESLESTPSSLYGILYACVCECCVPKFSLFYKDTTNVGRRPTLVNSS